jgi:RimJ/RimL family protein N-acetyltransferase
MPEFYSAGMARNPLASRRRSSPGGAAECARRARRLGGMALAEPDGQITTAYGIALEVRPLTSADRDRLAVAFGRMSERSRLRRFLAPKPRLSAAELSYLTDIDHLSHAALAVVDPEDGRIVGVARYATEPDDPDTADLACFVIDAWQGQRVGTMLAQRIVQRADANGIARLTASTFTDNRPARAMLLRLGFRSTGFGGGIINLERPGASPNGH